jgi:hypothetical protein
MPKLDRTGPFGGGPLSGKGFGHCGFSRQRWLGRFFEWGWPAGEKDKKEALINYKKDLETELEAVKKELKE